MLHSNAPLWNRAIFCATEHVSRGRGTDWIVTVFPIVHDAGGEIIWVTRGTATCCGHCLVFDTMEEASGNWIRFLRLPV